MNTVANSEGIRPLRTKTIFVFGSLIVLSAIGIAVVRSLAPDSDFAIANVLTAAISVLAWIFSFTALRLSNLPRKVWRSIFMLPILGSIVFFSMFKVVRVDGDLKPQFQWRFSQAVALPGSDRRLSARSEGIFAARKTDFPQYLGKNRDAAVLDVALANNWTKHPPKIVWKQPIGEGWSGFAVQGDVAVTMEQRDDQEWVTAYSVLDGSLLWHYDTDARHFNMLGGVGPRSTPTIVDNRVYVSSAVSHFACLDIVTGERIWSVELLSLANTTQQDFEQAVSWGRSASALVHSHTVYVALGGKGESAKTLIALDADTGLERWRSGTDQISYSSPALATIDGQQQLLLISENHLGSYALDSGQPLWSTPWPGQSNGSASVSQPIVAGNSRILISKGYGQGSELVEVLHDQENWTPSIVWSNATNLRTKFTTAALFEGYVYGLSDGILECVELETGERQWKKGRYRQGQLLLVGNQLLISSEQGEIILVAANPNKFEETARMQVIGDVTWNTLALSGNRLLVRNSDEAACVLLPLAESNEHENEPQAPSGDN